MKKLSLLSVLIIIVLFVSTSAVAAKPIKIVTTIGQLTDIVRTIGGDHVLVQGLMGAGVDPHLYKASESDVRKLSEAQIIFYSGLNLEAKLGAIFEQMNKNTKVVATGEVVPKEELLESVQYKGHYDPHIWFDVEKWVLVVNRVRDTLADYDPLNRKDYFLNALELAAELDKLHQYVLSRSTMLSKDSRVLVTAHDAFRYFGQKYDFEVIGLQGISTESQAGSADIKRIADFITERKIKSIFVETSVPERNIKAVQEAVKAQGWDVSIGGELFSDALGDEGTFEGTYIGMVTHNIDTIVDALQ